MDGTACSICGYKLAAITWTTTGQLEKEILVEATEATVIDWGDGTTSEITTVVKTLRHTYAPTVPSSVTVTIKDDILEVLEVYTSQVTELDVSNSAALRYLLCDDNQLTELDVSKNIALEYLTCGGNNFSSLDIRNNENLSAVSENLDTIYMTEYQNSYLSKVVENSVCGMEPEFDGIHVHPNTTVTTGESIIALADIPVGAYIQYAPSNATVTVLATDSGYDTDQTFTTSDYTSGWKVFKNNDGPLDIISAESLGSLYLSCYTFS